MLKVNATGSCTVHTRFRAQRCQAQITKRNKENISELKRYTTICNVYTIKKLKVVENKKIITL